MHGAGLFRGPCQLEMTASSWEPKNVPDTHVHIVSACAMSFATSPCWRACNLSSCSPLLHRLHVTSPKGALTSRHHSSPSNLRQGAVFTRASKVDHFLEKLFKYLTRCVNSPKEADFQTCYSLGF